MDENNYDDRIISEETAQKIDGAKQSFGMGRDVIANRLEKHEINQKDIEAFDNAGKNEVDHSSRFGGINKDKDEDSSSKSKNSLGKKDGLDESDGLGDKDNLDSKDLSKNDKSNKKDKKDKDDGKDKKSLKEQVQGGIDNKIAQVKRKIKATLILIGIIVAALLIFFILMFFMYAYDTIFGSISSFFGVSEADSEEGLSYEEADGLLTDDQYIINPDTGDAYSEEELVEYLKSDNSCNTTSIFTRLGDLFAGDRFRNYCSFYRFTQGYIDELEEEYNIELDRGLVVSSLFYGFGNQASYYDYENLDGVEDQIDAFQHYKALESIIADGDILTKTNVQSLIDGEVLDQSHDYYSWEIKVEEDDDGEKTATGYCTKNHIDNVQYSLYKWQIMMRFGEEMSDLYQSELQYLNSYTASDDECKLNMSDEELLAIVQESNPDAEAKLDSSVRKYNNYFLEKGDAPDLTPFSQKANTETSTADSFNNYKSYELTYRNGFVFKFFPAYEKSFNESNINLQYDYIVTPKEIEENIELIINRKADINYYLGYSDLDTNEYTQIGNYVIGANCEKYLTAAPDAIQVKVTDCDGNYIRTTSFKDYIMGVAYGEVSNSGDNYVLSEMVAAISYSLHRRNNYSKGTTITMRSGNCDQVYCPMKDGCHSKTASISCGSFKCTSYLPGSGWHSAASSSLQEKYANYYETAKNYILVSNGKVHNAHYVSSIQNNWKSKADKGEDFTQIMQEQYASEGAQLIKCNGSDTTTQTEDETSSDSGEKYGNTTSTDYPYKHADAGKFYGFSYNKSTGRNITINPEWKSHNLVSINSNCSSGGWSKSYTVHKDAVTNFSKAFKSICTMLTSGITLSDGTKCKYTTSDLLNGGTFVERNTSSGTRSLHAFGIAQDWNYSMTKTINGVKYAPYAGQGSSYKSVYDKFVAALGKEESCNNVNYILYKYAYKDAGFNWGGNWSSEYWDGMHYEIAY